MSVRPRRATNRTRVRADVSTLRIVAIVALGSYAIAASTPSAAPGGSFVPVFSIAKSENKNQVQYVVRVDNHCAPSGPAPMSAYWRMLEKGPTQTAPILDGEVRAYGLASQVVVTSDASGGRVQAVLKALPSRSLTIATSRGADGACRAVATASIAGAPAHFFNVYVHLRWYGVDYLLLQGWALGGSHVVRETIKK
jgi:hypothetical protein